MILGSIFNSHIFTKMKTLINKITLILVAVTFTLFVSCSEGNTPETVAKSFLLHTTKGEFAKAKKYADPATLSMFETIEKLGGEKMVEEAKKQEITIEILSSEVNENTAIVKYRSKSKENKNESEQSINLTKIDGKWKASITQ